MIRPFRVDVPLETVRDLRERVHATHWPQGVTDSGGIPLVEMQNLARYWLEEFDWSARQEELNRLPHFRVEVDGMQVHFIHAKSTHPNAAPLLLLHGWPGSFVEMVSLLPMLAESFHVVVPSLPGYGFSDAPTTGGMSNERIATLCAELMTKLGYERFIVQGGDWGAGIATWLARRFPARLSGMHLNYVPGSYRPHVEGAPSGEEETFLQDAAQWSAEYGAYGHVQRTRPLTLGYALSDSPVGLAAWIVEKFREWADPRSEIPLDAILTNVTIYWATNTIASSMRLYLESAKTPHQFARGERVRVPCGVARFPFEAPFPPRSWIERGYDIVHWTEMPRGGHFAALEAPELLARDVQKFVATLV